MGIRWNPAQLFRKPPAHLGQDVPLDQLLKRRDLVGQRLEFPLDMPPDKVVPAILDTPLSSFVKDAHGVPGIKSSKLSQDAPFGAPGTERVLTTTDGSHMTERALLREPRQFTYRVDRFEKDGKPASQPDLGLSTFKVVPGTAKNGQQTSRVIWDYRMRLDPTTFPGNLGPVGRLLFRATFFTHNWREFMKEAAKNMQDVLPEYKQ